MKNTAIKLLTLLFLVSMIFASCSKNNSSSNEQPIDETMLYGKWQSIEHIVNGQTYYFDVKIDISSDGSGTIETIDVNNHLTFPFTWTLSGSSLKITANDNIATFKIENLTVSQVTISGDTFPGLPNINLTSYKGTYNKI